jgi:hypothetical protein
MGSWGIRIESDFSVFQDGNMRHPIGAASNFDHNQVPYRSKLQSWGDATDECAVDQDFRAPRSPDDNRANVFSL